MLWSKSPSSNLSSLSGPPSPAQGDDLNSMFFWVVFGCLRVLEFFVNFLISINSILYIICRTAFLFALQIPYLNLPERIFRDFIEPFLAHHEKKIDKGIKEGKKLAAEATEKAMDIAEDVADKAKETYEKMTK
ncbi:TB2/DP1/HVA22-related protein like protein [Aduncisulcus paluster]|uniref:TB2/DP1/HVA22-related protein like protein n=1 Tax=Aduncisulcus paluster TaxID=2918883 RepID=A0ABQ5KWX3_9EUKA|nr:TB2/DP1/HVA22-related protein like protein [Aduncisulcus paluster]